MKHTLEERDLDAAITAKKRAISSEHHTSVCLMAQFAKRITGKEIVYGSTPSAASFDPRGISYTFRVEGLQSLVWAFDIENYERIREQLPLEVEVTIEE